MYVDYEQAITHLGMDPTSVNIPVPNNLLIEMHRAVFKKKSKNFKQSMSINQKLSQLC